MRLWLLEGCKQRVHVAKNAPPHSPLGRFMRGCLQIMKQGSEFVVAFAHGGFECRDRGPAVGNDAVTPAFRRCKQAFGSAIIGTERGERVLNRKRINLAHQSADKLLLAPKRAARRNACRRMNGRAKLIVKRQRRKFAVVECDQPLAELLALEIFALARTFAGLRRSQRLSYLALLPAKQDGS